jgi:hypothetical protein
VQVRREPHGGAQIVWLTIDNGAKLNTLGSPVMERLADAVNAAGADPAVRAVVLTGAGPRAFIGGADIGEMAALDASSARASVTRVHRCCDVWRRMVSLSLPTPTGNICSSASSCRPSYLWNESQETREQDRAISSNDRGLGAYSAVIVTAAFR